MVGRSSQPKRGLDGGPPNKAQRNFTDPDSRILSIKGSVVQGYNCQIAVDAAHQIIIAQRLQTSPVDAHGLKPLLSAARAAPWPQSQRALRRRGVLHPILISSTWPAAASTASWLQAEHATVTRARLANGRRGSGIAAMALKLKRAGRRSRDRLRKQIVEPVFGQIKHARGFRQFLLRGLDNVRGEWAIICTAHLLKLANATR